MLIRMPGSYYAARQSGCAFNSRSDTYASVHARDGHQGPRRAVAAIDHVQLSAANVELCATDARSDVQSDLAGE